MKKRNSIVVLALLFVAVLTGVVVFNTIAKYTSEITKSGDASVAAWNFATDNAGTTLTFGIPTTADANVLVDQKLAPGTYGSFTINVTNTSDVGADVTLALQSITGKPTNLKFYKTRSGEAGSYTYSDELVPGNATTGVISGKLAAGTSTPVPVTIYWNWAYETTDGDATDTSEGATHADITATVKVTGTQLAPGTTVSTWGF